MVQPSILMIRPQALLPVAAAHALYEDGSSISSSKFCNLSYSFGLRFRGRNSATATLRSGKTHQKCLKVDVTRALSDDTQSDDDAQPARASSSSPSPLRLAADYGNGKNQRRQEETKKPKRRWKSETGRTVKKTYPARVRAILNSIQERPDSEIEQGLEQWKGQLEIREQSIVLNQEKSWYRALRIFSWLQKQDDYSPNVIHYNILLKVLGREGKLELVEKLWKEMEEKNVPPTNVSYSTLIDSHGKAGNPGKALEWLEDMKRRGMDPDEVTRNTLVNLHKQSGNVDAAEKAFNSFSRNVDTCNTMIDLYGRLGRFGDASRIFAEMMEHGISADTVSFNTMIKVCGMAGRVEEAEAVFHSMQRTGLSPDVVTFNVLIGVFLKGGMIQQGLDYFSRMKELEIRPDLVTYQTLLSALTIRDMVSNAEALAKEMAELGIEAGEVVSVELARMHIRAGLFDQANEVLKNYISGASLSSSNLAVLIDSYAEERMWREAEELFLGCQNSWSVQNFNAMIKAYGLAALQDKAWELFSSIKVGKGVSKDGITYNTMIHTLCTASPVNVERVEHVVSEAQQQGYDLLRSTFNVVITMYSRLGKAREAQQTFEQMEAAGVAPDGISYGALVNAFAEVKSVKDAEKTAIAMRKAGFSPNRIVFTTLMKLYGKVNNIQDVERMYADMGRAGAAPDLFATNFLIDQYAKAGQVKDAERIFRGLTEYVGGLSVNEVTLTIMLEMYKTSGLIPRALGMAKRMLNMDGLKDIVSYNSIIGLYVTLGRVSQAVEVFQSLSTKNVEPDMITYTIMASLLKKIGSFQEALDLFTTAMSSGLSVTVQSMTTLVSIYARGGMVKEAFQTCKKLLGGGFTLDNAAFNAMIYAYGTAGRFDESLRLFMAMQSHGLQPDVITYTTVITVYGKAGLLEGVSRMFKRMKQVGCEPSEVTYRVVIDIYKTAGKLDLAAMVQQEMQFARYISGEMLPEQVDKSSDG